jgi:hypothetical protein
MRILYYVYIVAFVALISCEKAAESTSLASTTGKGGSLTRFTIAGNYLYAVDAHFLYTINITDPANPVKAGQSDLNFDMETIYNYGSYLFVGSRTGLYIYSISTPSSPRLVGEAKHARSCDPVVANDTASYTTLFGSSTCGPATSGLYVHDVRNVQTPFLKKTIPLNNPIGLGMADSALYVCCGSEGLKIFSIKDAYNPVLIQTKPDGHFVDLIPYGDLLICRVNNGLRLYDITNRLAPSFIKEVTN